MSTEPDIPKTPGSLPPLLGEPERQDIHRLHEAILQRERVEPAEGMEPAPWWVWAVSVVVIFAMGFYLGRYSGSFSTAPHELYERAAMTTASSEPAVPNGELIYTSICQPCHQAGGIGVEGTFPPLAGSTWVSGDPAIPARIVLHGLIGPIEVSGKKFKGEMPPLGSQLNDAEIAAVLTHVRSSWGNTGDPVDEELVSKLRASEGRRKWWTAAELEAMR